MAGPHNDLAVSLPRFCGGSYLVKYRVVPSNYLGTEGLKIAQMRENPPPSLRSFPLLARARMGPGGGCQTQECCCTYQMAGPHNDLAVSLPRFCGGSYLVKYRVVPSNYLGTED